MSESELRTWAKLATEEWRFQVDVDNAFAIIVRPDPDNRRLRIGPLATVPLGLTGHDDEDEPCAFIDDNDDGRNLFAIACLPEVARLITWIDEHAPQCADVIFKSKETAEFLRELYRRVAWIKEAVDTRAATINDGEHGLARFEVKK